MKKAVKNIKQTILTIFIILIIIFTINFVSAVNCSDPSLVIFPTAPSRVDNGALKRITIRWADTQDCPAEDYEVLRCDGASCNPATIIDTILDPSQKTYNDGNVEWNSIYTYAIEANYTIQGKKKGPSSTFVMGDRPYNSQYPREVCQIDPGCDGRDYPTGANTQACVYIWVYDEASGQQIKSKKCPNQDSEQPCKIEDLGQENICWDCASQRGDYFMSAYAIAAKNLEPQTNITPPISLFSCVGYGEECESDEGCLSLVNPVTGVKNEQGYCVQANAQEDKYCRATPTFCGDQYCADSENCPDATRETDLMSCPEDLAGPVNTRYSYGQYACKAYSCANGCVRTNLPAGDYPAEIEDKGIYPYSASGEPPWSCNYEDNCRHCDGNGSCVSSCFDADNDGYGTQQPITGINGEQLYHSDCCPAGGTPPTSCLLNQEGLNYAGTCSNGVDDNCNGEWDYDTQNWTSSIPRGAPYHSKGEKSCNITINRIQIVGGFARIQ